jgi:hypothetical protein
MSELDELRALVRQVIRDVLPGELPVTETVNLSTDEDLAVFVARLLDADAQTREDLRAGRKRFRLAAGIVPPVPQTSPRRTAVNTPETSENFASPGANGRSALNGSAGVPVRRIERGAVTERVVRDAARAGERLVLGRGAVLTPLARDRARSSGVEIERER